MMDKITDAQIAKGLDEFEKGQNELSKLMKTCGFIKQPNYTSIPMVYSDCTHPKSKYGVCARYDECPILKVKMTCAFCDTFAAREMGFCEGCERRGR